MSEPPDPAAPLLGGRAEDLGAFYRSPLGRTARRLIRRDLRHRWPSLRGLRLLGIGWPTPYLRPFRDEAEGLVAALAAEHGALAWPKEGPFLTCVAHEDELPLPDLAFDRVLLVHALETSESPAALLREVWRVLAPEGRVILVVPNRRGAWARSDKTPFGDGRPYSVGQIERLLTRHMFEPVGVAPTLFIPPLTWTPLLRAAGAWDRLGARWARGLGGVVLVEARKRVAAPVLPRRAMRLRPRFLPVSLPQPAHRDGRRQRRDEPGPA